MATWTERLRHERTRFSGMTLPQLRTRLYKITVRPKLAAFIQVAGEHNLDQLVAMAERRARDLGFTVSRSSHTGRVYLRPPNDRPGRPRVPRTRLPRTDQILARETDGLDHLLGRTEEERPTEEQLEIQKENERISRGVRKIRFNHKKKEEKPHQPRLPGMEE